jgi:transposase-like protein
MDRHTYLTGGARIVAKRGTELPHAKLTDADIAAIRRQHARKQRLIDHLNQRYSIAGIAEHYGVHPNTIERALRHDTWAHVRTA